MAAFVAVWGSLCLFLFPSEAYARALPKEFTPPISPNAPILASGPNQIPLTTNRFLSSTLWDLVHALDVMQDGYFELWQGTWPTSIDWTAAVLGTHVSATLSSLTATVSDDLLSTILQDTLGDGQQQLTISQNTVAFENLINHYFDQLAAFYFGENAFSLRTQAFDDMQWVVLGWLENIKFQVLHSDLHYVKQPWHGVQFQSPAAHRVRIFYELASEGWDTSLCGGGMIWNSRLTPYKNAITNELWVSASIAMYLYFPGDDIDSPFLGSTGDKQSSHSYPHNPAHLYNAIEAYRWFKDSNMTGEGGLYADGFHIRGWQSAQQPGTRKCDVLNTMEYTYNQGVVLSGLRGLWLATGSDQYIQDGHNLVRNVIKATGWPNVDDHRWAGLGRAGVIEDACDANGDCSQDGQTFKSIFFHHLAEFCRPIYPQEERFLTSQARAESSWQPSYNSHQTWCSRYRPWIEHNANAALITRNDDGKFGMWWGRRYRVFDDSISDRSPLPRGATDYRNYPNTVNPEGWGNLTELIHDAEALVDNIIKKKGQPEYNDRGRGRTVETQAGGVAVLRALYQWKTTQSLGGFS